MVACRRYHRPSAGLELGEPLIFKALAYLPSPHSARMKRLKSMRSRRRWFGVSITALNLIPILQLDGGHAFYGLLLRCAYPVARLMLLFAMLGVVVFGYLGWSLMILLSR